MFNETTGMNITIVTNATVNEWELIMSHVQYVRLIMIIISFADKFYLIINFDFKIDYHKHTQ